MYTRPRDQKRRDVETPVTLWIPNDLLATLDDQLTRQQAAVAAAAPGARITRHAFLITELRRLLTSSPTSTTENITPQP